MIEAETLKVLDYWVNKYSKLVRDNEKQRIAMKNQLDEINVLRTNAMEWEQKFYNVQEMLNAERKDKERVLQVNQDLTDKLTKLQGGNNDAE